MATLLLWVGLTLVVALPEITTRVPWELVGAIVMIIGAVVLMLDYIRTL